ncbi:secreted aspartic proteinase 1 [Scheffersomyces xylosifermentans]|uniref:secreted aspartic proteinase 1 n=1 Tax=Scheffersomyces xylosifermentans TaxID=1304137 RepID=UPI00315D9D7A
MPGLILSLYSVVNGLAVPQDGPSKGLVARDNKYLKLDFQVARDIGSLWSWIIGAGAVCHGSDTTFCHDFGVYNKSTSSSSKDLGIPGKQVYGYASIPNSYTAFSLYLNEATAASGSIIFGGVDKSKYEGSLVTLPMKHRGSFSIKWNSITIDGKELTANVNQTLDTGSALTYVPDDIYNAIASAVGATSVNKAPCRQPSDKYVSFNFDGVTIKVPYTDLVELRYTNGVLNEYCGLTVRSTKDNKYYILGDNFLRSAYAVYNLDDSTVSLAQVNYTKDSEIVAM